MMIGEPPTRLETNKRSAIGPQRQKRHAAKIDNDPAATGRIDVGKLAPRHVDHFENNGAGQFVVRERHLAAAKIDLACFAGEIIPRRKKAAIKTARHLKTKRIERSGGDT